MPTNEAVDRLFEAIVTINLLVISSQKSNVKKFNVTFKRMRVSFLNIKMSGLTF